MRRSRTIIFTALLCLTALAAAGPAFAAPKSLAPGATPDAVSQNPGAAAVPWVLRPDLKIGKLWIAKYDPADANAEHPDPLTKDPTVGEKIWLIGDGANVGADARDAAIGFYVDGEMVWNNTWIDLASGASKRGIGPYPCPKEGSHTLECVLDVNNVLSDREPTNNRVKLGFTVKPKPTVVNKPPGELKTVPASRSRTRRPPPGALTGRFSPRGRCSGAAASGSRGGRGGRCAACPPPRRVPRGRGTGRASRP